MFVIMSRVFSYHPHSICSSCFNDTLIRTTVRKRYFFLAPNFWIACTKNVFNYKKNGADYPIPHHLTQKFVPPTIRPAKCSGIPRTTRPNLICYSQAFYWNRPVFRVPNILLFSGFLSVKLRYSLKQRIIAVKLSKFNVNCRKRKIGKN